MPDVAVSVVVPVYNPGSDIEPCIASLLDQSLPPDHLELIFVDDGSTDGTAARLDRLAAEHSHVRVIHEPNSGWAGRPRNVGTDVSTGEFVQYVDQDDELGPKALERLHAFATANAADIVIGKVTSDFRVVPHDLWRTNVGRCSIRSHPLISSLTPHKMFRTEFLRRTGIRFPEGRRRLEDQVFMVAAYFATDAVAILGDYPCYYYLRRDTGENSGTADVDPAGYYDNLREVLDLVEAHTEPGAFRDSLLARFAQPIVRRASGVLTDPSLPPGYAETLVEHARHVVLERFSESLRESLPTFRRTRIEAIAAGDLPRLRELSEQVAGIRAAAEVTAIGDISGGWLLRVTAGLRDRDGKIVDAGTDPRDTTDTSVFARERRRAVEWPAGDLDGLEGEVEVLPRQLAGGRPLGNGSWQLSVRVQALGLTRTARLTLRDAHQVEPVKLRRGAAVASLEQGAIVRVRATDAPG